LHTNFSFCFWPFPFGSWLGIGGLYMFLKGGKDRVFQRLKSLIEERILGIAHCFALHLRPKFFTHAIIPPFKKI
jgi:hypothetical protein